MASGRQRWFVSDLLFSLLTTNMLGRIDCRSQERLLPTSWGSVPALGLISLSCG